MISGRESRKQIDTENVRALLLVNGGGAVALLAFLPSVLDRPALAVAVLCSLIIFQLGLLAAVLHNTLRRKCDLAYEIAQAESPSHPEPCQFFGIKFQEPCVCVWSYAFMWSSMAMFMVGGGVVFVGGVVFLW